MRKERPILFSAPMVRAILAGTKTQTRRTVKRVSSDCVGFFDDGDGEWAQRFMDERGNPHLKAWRDRCPYGQTGDRLWVRETWLHIEGGCIYDAAGGLMDSHDPETIYRADRPHYPGPWKPAIHMPRWASRITLEVTGVRVERLHEISEADAIAEGVNNSLHLPGGRFARENFAHLWWTINGDGSWEANPWVWVVEFRRV